MSLLVRAREATETAPDPGRRYCHLLDEQGRAYCFATTSGHVHGRIREAGRCAGCGRLACPRCDEIAEALGMAA